MTSFHTAVCAIVTIASILLGARVQPVHAADTVQSTASVNLPTETPMQMMQFQPVQTMQFQQVPILHTEPVHGLSTFGSEGGSAAGSAMEVRHDNPGTEPHHDNSHN